MVGNWDHHWSDLNLVCLTDSVSKSRLWNLEKALKLMKLLKVGLVVEKTLEESDLARKQVLAGLKDQMELILSTQLTPCLHLWASALASVALI